MTAATVDQPYLLHSMPGRVRVHVPDWSTVGPRSLTQALRQEVGVENAEANVRTGNVLVRFDPSSIDSTTVLGAVSRLVERLRGTASSEPVLPPVVHQRRRTGSRARIAMRGLDSQPEVARQAEDRLRRISGVKQVHASALTGRLLVEYDHHRLDFDDLLAAVAHIDLPALPGEDWPQDPMDSGRLTQSAVRVTGATLGLSLLAARRLGNVREPLGLRNAAVNASTAITILQGFPRVRYGLRHLLGRDVADLLIYVPIIVSLTLAGNPLGLVLTAAEGMRLLTEVVARRNAWQRYEERASNSPAAEPGSSIRVESGERAPLAARVVEGTGTAAGIDGLPIPAAPGHEVPSGSRLFGGPFVLQLGNRVGFTDEPRPAPPAPTAFNRYIHLLSPIALSYAALTALLTRSFSRTLTSLVLVTPRSAMIGQESADLGAAARVIRAGVTVVGTRPERVIRLPTVLLVGGTRTLTDGFEVTNVVPYDESCDASELLLVAEGIAAATGAPWGGALSRTGGAPATDGSFDGASARATVHGTQYVLGPIAAEDQVPASVRLRHRGNCLLELRVEGAAEPLGFIGIRARLAPGIDDLVGACRRHGVDLALAGTGDPLAGWDVAHRAGLAFIAEDAVSAIRRSQAQGSLVTFLSDSPADAPGFAAADLGIGLTSGRSGHFPARADLLAPDLAAAAAVIDAGARRDATVRDSIVFSAAANGLGAVWGISGGPGIQRALYAVYGSALAALADGFLRLRGGERPISSITRLVDPRPERWGRRSVESTLRALHTAEHGLTNAQAAERRQVERPPAARSGLVRALLEQARSPLTAILAAGATLSVILGSTADVVMISATIVANAVVGAWQEHQAGQAVAALQRIGTTTGNVLRDGRVVKIPVDEIVPGDILTLAPGDRVAADARLISGRSLEVDEASLTGESFPVPKEAEGGTDASRIVLAGSDVTVGTGRAVVVAVGRRTRMGATAAALALDETRASPLGVRLNRMFRQILPLIGGGGLLVIGSGLLRGQPLLPQLAIGATMAIAAVPEGLPLLAGAGEAAVARRLGARRALVRRLSAVEALGRVDVACTDKTGTLTEGKLSLTLVATLENEAGPENAHSVGLHEVLLTAGLATPHPDAPDAASHPTDIAVRQGAEAGGLAEQLRVQRTAEVPFDPVRPFHASIAGGKLRVKGAVETLLPRCTSMRRDGRVLTMGATRRDALQARAQELAERGLRILMVAEGPPDATPGDPRGLTALGYVGIQDPLRADVPDAVRRCQEAGVKVIMLTGDHPATARAIAREAGLLNGAGTVITGSDIAELDNGALDAKMAQATVVARVTPLDKLRIVESLQRQGHTVAMTGDGVNDAPALRLADVGVAMGRGGTEVARQAAAVVLADDDFSTLVEALVEGRSFWRNIRRALGLLLGGNLGELGLMVGGSVLGVAAPLVTRQILAVNLVTDVLPSLAVALQPPESRDLSSLAREGTAALDTPLRNDVLRRGGLTAGLSLAAYLLALGSGGLPQARSVAFASVVGTQLAQTLDAGRAEGALTRPVLAAVAGSTGILVAALTVAPLRSFLALVAPSPFGWLLIASTAVAAAAISSLLRLPVHLPVPTVRIPARLPSVALKQT